jgi:hypothetical protein
MTWCGWMLNQVRHDALQEMRMTKKKTLLDDGRYIIYFTFEKKTAGAKPKTPRKGGKK